MISNNLITKTVFLSSLKLHIQLLQSTTIDIKKLFDLSLKPSPYLEQRT